MSLPPRLTSPALLFLASLFLAAPLAAQPPKPDNPRFKTVSPKLHEADGWAIAAPADWKASLLPRPVVLHLRGDGTTAIPLFDGALAPLMIGLLVEVYDKSDLALKDRIDAHLKELKTTPTFKTRREPTVEELTLADGTKARLLSAEFDRLDNRRLTFHFRAYAPAADGRRIEAVGFITCSPTGGGFVKATSLNVLLKAHVASLVLDPKKFAEEPLKKLYTAHNWGINAALAKTAEGNDHLDNKKYAEAALAYREALSLCPEISAAHNGLAYTLITTDHPKLRDLKDGLRHAKTAVAQTERRDHAALDTLALAHFEAGDRDQALALIREALKLAPSNETLKGRLQIFESSK